MLTKTPKKNPGFVTNKDTINALRSLCDASGGVLKPETVVDAARDPESPLHRHFEWDDSVAAEQWHIIQARTLLRISVEYISNDSTETPSRVYVSLSTDQADEGGYRLTTNVMSDEDLREILLRDARRDMELFKTRYSRLKELASVIRAMNDVI